MAEDTLPYKTCSKCHTPQLLSEFYLTPKGFPRSLCKSCYSLENQRQREANPLLTKARKRADYLANKDRIQNRARMWALNNPEKRKVIEQRWASNNKEKCQDRVRRRRARVRAVDGSFTSKEWTDLCRRFNCRCVACGVYESLTVDHIIPVSWGGTSFIDNIQPLCLSCNSRKRDRAIDYRLPWKVARKFKQAI